MPPVLGEASGPAPGLSFDGDGDQEMSGTDHASPFGSHDATNMSMDSGENGSASPFPSAPPATSMNGVKHQMSQPKDSTPIAKHTQSRSPLPCGTLDSISISTLTFDHQCEFLNTFFRDAAPEALRRVIRDNWQKSLLFSDYHKEFLVRVIMSSVNKSSRDRMTQRLADVVTPAMGTAVAEKLTAAQIDMASALLLQHASDKFLTSCLYKRLETIDARKLVDALAFQKRLGFELSDELGDGEQVIPANDNRKNAAATGPPEKGSSGDMAGVYQCLDCDRKFIQQAPFLYHTKNRKCQEVPKGQILSRCGACGAAFSSSGGIGYHASNNVCGGFGGDTVGTAPSSASTPAQRPQAAPVPVPKHVPSSTSVPSSTPAPVHTPAVAPSAESQLIWKPPLTQTPKPATQVPSQSYDVVRSDIQPTGHSPAPAPMPSSGFTPVPASRSARQTPNQQIRTPAKDNPTPSSVASRFTPSIESDELKNALAQLTEDQRADYYDRMTKQEQAYERKIRDARRDYSGEAQVVKLKTLKACFAAAQSSVRQRFGIKLRARRPAAATLAENKRLGFETTPSQERRAAQQAAKTRTSYGANGAQGVGHQPGQAHNSIPAQPQTPQVAVSDMNGGLAGSSATAAMEDPTVHASPSRVRSGFVAYNAAPVPSRPPPMQQGGYTQPPPIEIESSDDSDSDIPGA